MRKRLSQMDSTYPPHPHKEEREGGEVTSDGYELRSDEEPWVGIADKVMDGEFDDADDSTRVSVQIGLRSIHHPKCQDAVKRLEDPSKKREKKVVAPRKQGAAKPGKAKAVEGGLW